MATTAAAHGRRRIARLARQLTAAPATASLAGKVALVTGGTGAIGSAVAAQLAALGCRIIVVDLDEGKCEAFAKTLPTRSTGVAFNVADEASVVGGVSRALRRLREIGGAAQGVEGVDILINIAGILSNNKLFETTAQEWARVNSINYDGCFFLAKACMKHMQRQKWGRVVNMSSWAWKSGGLTAGTAYSSSKAAVVGLTFSLARQFAADGITVNGVAPCYVFSRMIMEQLTQAQREELLTKIPVGKFCTPEEVAHGVCFFVSPRSGFITGEILDMNGGFQMD